MFKRVAVVVGLIVSWSQVAWAQTDTTYLREVQIYGMPVTSHATGARISQLSAGDIGTLSDKLRDDVPLYLNPMAIINCQPSPSGGQQHHRPRFFGMGSISIYQQPGKLT